MENAAKALLMAGGALIAILLLTLFSYLYTQMGESTGELYDVMEQSELTEFNQKFLVYSGRGINPNTSPLKVQDVATIINLALDNKNNTVLNYSPVVHVWYNNSIELTASTYADWLESKKASNPEFNCTVSVDANTLFVNRVDITDHTT